MARPTKITGMDVTPFSGVKIQKVGAIYNAHFGRGRSHLPWKGCIYIYIHTIINYLNIIPRLGLVGNIISRTLSLMKPWTLQRQMHGLAGSLHSDKQSRKISLLAVGIPQGLQSSTINQLVFQPPIDQWLICNQQCMWNIDPQNPNVGG